MIRDNTQEGKICVAYCGDDQCNCAARRAIESKEFRERVIKDLIQNRVIVDKDEPTTDE